MTFGRGQAAIFAGQFSRRRTLGRSARMQQNFAHRPVSSSSPLLPKGLAIFIPRRGSPYLPSSSDETPQTDPLDNAGAEVSTTRAPRRSSAYDYSDNLKHQPISRRRSLLLPSAKFSLLPPSFSPSYSIPTTTMHLTMLDPFFFRRSKLLSPFNSNAARLHGCTVTPRSVSSFMHCASDNPVSLILSKQDPR